MIRSLEDILVRVRSAMGLCDVDPSGLSVTRGPLGVDAFAALPLGPLSPPLVPPTVAVIAPPFVPAAPRPKPAAPAAAAAAGAASAAAGGAGGSTLATSAPWSTILFPPGDFSPKVQDSKMDPSFPICIKCWITPAPAEPACPNGGPQSHSKSHLHGSTFLKPASLAAALSAVQSPSFKAWGAAKGLRPDLMQLLQTAA